MHSPILMLPRRSGISIRIDWLVDVGSGTVVAVDGKAMVGKPRTAKSNREIGLDPAMVTAQRSHRAQSSEERLKWGPAHQGSELVFTWEDGTPIHPDILTRTFQRLAKSAGLPVIRLHDLRHSYATAALEAGVSMKVVQERLGHASIAVTSDLYSHVRPEVDQAADKVAGFIFGACMGGRVAGWLHRTKCLL